MRALSGTREVKRIGIRHVGTLLLLLGPATPWQATPLPAAENEAREQEQQESAEPAAEEFAEEILVTARRREENVQEIPISVTALSEDELEARSLATLNDLDNFIPNLNFSVSGGFGDEGSETTIFMRGVGQLQGQRFNTDSGVGIYIDGVFVARSQGAVFDLIELDRVEILRGPQGTLFGRNAIGGAISLVTKMPDSQFQARLAATVGEFDRADLEGSVSGALADGLNASLALASANRDGFSVSRWTGQEFNDINYDAARTAFHWQPSASVSVQAAGDYTYKREAGLNMLLLNVDQVAIVDFFNRAMSAAGREGYSNEWASDSTRYSYSGLDSFLDSDIYGVSVQTAWTGAALSLHSITSYRGFDISSATDGDGTPSLWAERERTQRQDQISQELRFSGLALSDRLSWQTGLLYFRERPRGVSRGLVFRDLEAVLDSLPGPIISPPGAPSFLCNPGPPPPGVPCFGGPGNPINGAFAPDTDYMFLDMTTVSTAAFGEASYQLSDRAELTVGLRHSRDEKQMLHFQAASPLGEEPTDARSDEESWSAWTPRVSLACQLAPDVLLYATASRGFKSGGFDSRVSEAREGFASYRPELMWTYEAGIKSWFFGRRLKINQSTFFSDYEGIQFTVAEILDNLPAPAIKNAGAAEIFGFELETEARLAPGLVLNAGGGYTDVDMVEIDPASGIPQDALYPKTPEWSYNLALQYAFSAGRGSMIARLDYGWRGDFFHTFDNLPFTEQEAYGLLAARLLFAPGSDRWDLAVFGTNLTGEEYLETSLGLEAVGTTLGIGARPREWGVTFQLRFPRP